MKKIIFTGGGSGGHIYPIIAIVEELKSIYPKAAPPLKIFYLGPRTNLITDIKKEGIVAKIILSGKLRRYISPFAIIQNIIDVLIRLPIGIIQSFYYLIKIRPNLVFSKGGYGSMPVILVARLFNIPIIIHESDIAPGLSTRIAAKFARKVLV